MGRLLVLPVLFRAAPKRNFRQVQNQLVESLRLEFLQHVQFLRIQDIRFKGFASQESFHNSMG